MAAMNKHQAQQQHHRARVLAAWNEVLTQLALMEQAGCINTYTGTLITAEANRFERNLRDLLPDFQPGVCYR